MESKVFGNWFRMGIEVSEAGFFLFICFLGGFGQAGRGEGRGGKWEVGGMRVEGWKCALCNKSSWVGKVDALHHLGLCFQEQRTLDTVNNLLT